MTQRSPRRRATRRALAPLALAALAMALVAAAPAAGAPPTAPETVPGEVIVRLAPHAAAPARVARAARVDAVGQRPLRRIPRTRVIELAPGESVDEAVRRLELRGDVEWAEPNGIARIATVPDDPRFDELWGMHRIDGPTAWDRTTGDREVLVAVVDTGADPGHPDLQGNLRPGPSTNLRDDGAGVDPDAWRDLNGHGTHVAGTIGADGDNGTGVVGVNWEVGIAAVRVCGLLGTCKVSELAEGMAHAAAVGADVVNMSLTTYSDSQNTMRDVIAAHPDTLFVAAAGNDGKDVDATPSYPCAIDLPNVVCVAASDDGDDLAGFSNRGDGTVHLAAPGTSVLSSLPSMPPVVEEEFADLSAWTQDPAGRWETEQVTPSLRAMTLTDVMPLAPEATVELAAGADVSGVDACRVSYFLRGETEEGTQTLHVDASADGSAWTEVTSDPDGYSGDQAEFVQRTEDLSELDGEDELRVRFRFEVDGSADGTPATVEIARLRLACLGDQPAAGAYGMLQGTSMAAPHVAGAAALLLAVDDTLGPADLRRTLLETVEERPGLSGSTTTGGRLDAAAALAATPDPEPPTPSPDPGSEPGPSPDPEPVAAGELRPRSASVPVDDRGTAWVAVRCLPADAAEPCAGALAIEPAGTGEPLGSRAVALRPGRAETLAVRLTPEARTLLGRRGHLDARLATPGGSAARAITLVDRGAGDAFTLSARQLLINQRIGQAAIRRLARLEGRAVPPPRRGRAGEVTLSRRQLLINQRITQAAIHRVDRLRARAEGRPEPAPPRRGRAGTVTLSAAQLAINQRIGQAAIRRVSDLEAEAEG